MQKNEHIIEIRNLNKSFGEIKAVNDLSFNVRRGELFAFLGVNGAGKSTTISIMCNQLRKDSGEVLICGTSIDKPSRELQRKIGVVFQSSVLDGMLTVKDNLSCRGALYGIKGAELKQRIDYLAKLLDFEDLLGRTVEKLSGGQRRRIDIARALLQKPEILILDEPTTGLDPQTRKLMGDVITKLRVNDEMTVFLTTHYMEEAADADYIVILDSGKIVAEGSPLQLKNTYTGDFITIYGVSDDDVKTLGLPFERIRDAVRVEVPSTAEATKLIIAHPAIFADYEITKGKIDDVFLAVTGKNLQGGAAQ